jgi:hypothetical protein
VKSTSFMHRIVKHTKVDQHSFRIGVLHTPRIFGFQGRNPLLINSLLPGVISSLVFSKCLLLLSTRFSSNILRLISQPRFAFSSNPVIDRFLARVRANEPNECFCYPRVPFMRAISSLIGGLTEITVATAKASRGIPAQTPLY